MARKPRVAAVIDTYALIAASTQALSARAEEEFSRLRRGATTGAIHYLIAYEFLYQWRRGHIRGLRGESEILDFLRLNFVMRPFSLEFAARAARMKERGDRLLEEAEVPALRRKRLSAADSATIALAMSEKLPILTGDGDLTYVARALGVVVLW